MERLSRIFPAKRESILSPNESRMAAKSGVSTKPAPLFWDLFGRTGQHCPSPVPPVRFPTSTPKPRAEGACSPVGCVQARPRRQPRQVLLPLPQNRRKLWVFAGFLFACVAWLCGALWFGHWVFSPWFYSFPTVLIPSSTQNAPGFAFFGLFRVRFPLFCCFWVQNFRAGFCASCRIVVTS